jgi:hypothetical protein
LASQYYCFFKHQPGHHNTGRASTKTHVESHRWKLRSSTRQRVTAYQTPRSFTKFALPSPNSSQLPSTIMSGYDFVSSSFDPLPDEIRRGMISMGIFGLISSISTLSLLIFITYRMIYWRKYYDEPIATNQIFILIYNLLLADFQQALSFLISFYWISQNKLVGPSVACFAQGWLIQIGDMSSGLWVLAIAVHTFVGLVGQKQVPMRVFVFCVITLWMFCLALTAIGPIMIRKDFFVPAGAWVSWLYSHRAALVLIFNYSVGSMQTAKMNGSTCTTYGSSSPNSDLLSFTSPSSSSCELALLVPASSRAPPARPLKAARRTTNSARAALEQRPRS